MQTEKIAVIELSTKAVKWLIPKVDNETILTKPFSFKYFFRESQKTETGNGLNNKNVLDERYFVRRVLPFIKKAYKDVVESGVDIVYCVATAVYRSARNINSILQIIRDEIGLEVRVLTKEEEAEYTFWAYYYSTNYRDCLLRMPYTLLIDQGGGSTEITLFHQQKLVFRHSFDMGTTILKNDFFSQKFMSTEERLNYIDTKYQKIIFEELRGMKINETLRSSDEIYCICVGTAVTAAFSDGSRHNSDVHEKLLNECQIQKIIEVRSKEFSSLTVEELQAQIETGSGKTHTLEKRFASRLGLPIILEILHFFNVQDFRISGTGLWYGVFFTNLYEMRLD